jgi:hypothetical protein
MAEGTLLDRLLNAEDASNIELFAEDGEKVELEQVAVLMYVGNPYAILRPVSSKANEVAVYQLFEDDEDRIEFVEDKTLAQNVINRYIKSLSDESTEMPKNPETETAAKPETAEKSETAAKTETPDNPEI